MELECEICYCNTGTRNCKCIYIMCDECLDRVDRCPFCSQKLHQYVLKWSDRYRRFLCVELRDVEEDDFVWFDNV